MACPCPPSGPPPRGLLGPRTPGEETFLLDPPVEPYCLRSSICSLPVPSLATLSPDRSQIPDVSSPLPSAPRRTGCITLCSRGAAISHTPICPIRRVPRSYCQTLSRRRPKPMAGLWLFTGQVAGAEEARSRRTTSGVRTAAAAVELDAWAAAGHQLVAAAGGSSWWSRSWSSTLGRSSCRFRSDLAACSGVCGVDV